MESEFVSTFNWSLATAIIAVISSVLSPVLTALINNHHQQKLKRMELEYQRDLQLYNDKRATFESFLNAACGYIGYRSTNERQKFNQARYTIGMYVSLELFAEINSFAEMISKDGILTDDAYRSLYPISEKLSSTLGTPPKAPR